MSDEQQTTEQVVAPEVAEQAMVEKALTETPTSSLVDPAGNPADKAAAFFKKSAAELELLLRDMSLRAMKRMILNVATYPYLDRDYTVKRGSTEEKASYRFNEMMWQKTIMQLHFEQEKAMKAMAEGKDKEQLTLNKGEQDNGSDTTET